MVGRKSLLACALISLTSISTAGAAGAAPPAEATIVEHYVDFVDEVFEDFCGDLDIRFVLDETGTFVWRRVGGPDGLYYGQAARHGSASWTNLANGKSFTFVFNQIDKDLKVTDHGDGTRTILVLAAGSTNILGPDGTAVLRNPGQVRFEVVLDDAGTPSDPTDDEFVEFLGIVKDSTGRSDTEGRDFCEDLHIFIG